MLVIAIIVMGDFVLQNSLQQQYLSAQQKQVYSKMGELRAKLEYEVTSSLLLIQSMSTYIAVKPNLTSSEFNKFSGELFKRNEHLINITAAPGFTLKYVYPLKGNEALIGVNYRNVKSQWEKAKQAADTGKLVLAGPSKLIQGGQGLIGRAPVFYNGHVFWGLVSSVIDFDQVIYKINKANAISPVKYAICVQDDKGAVSSIIYGYPGLFRDKTAVRMNIRVPGGGWIMAAEPLGGWDSNNPYAMQIHLIIAIILMFVLYFGIGRIRKLKEIQRARAMEQEARMELEKLNSELHDRVNEEVEKNRQHVLALAEQRRFVDMGRMINVIAHQWRQPLNNIGLIAQMLEEMDEGVDFQTSREKLYQDHDNLVQYMSKTIDDFRNFFSMDKEKESFSLCCEIEKTCEMVKAQLKSCNIRLSFECSYVNDENSPSDVCYGYLYELKQVLLNIINNARDALQNRDVPDKEILIKIIKNNDSYDINIFNSGEAIPGEILENIFAPYFSTKRELQGAGLGLYMARTIIENHFKGKLYAENQINGVVFHIILPIESAESAQTDQ